MHANTTKMVVLHFRPMSGHSKWASIKHKKGAADAKRGKIFTRHAKLIEIAAREGGGGEPDSNPSLRTAIDNAKADNVPNANIERAIQKGTGELKDTAQTEEVTYEAYGPGGAAFIIECLTDNKNRTLPNVKTIIGKLGGKFAATGAVSWMFEKKGVVVVQSEKCRVQSEREALELLAIDANAEDINTHDDVMDITTSGEAWPKVRDVLKEAGCEIRAAGLKYVPTQTVDIQDADTAKKVIAFMSAREDDEDVSEVHTNADIDESVMKELERSELGE